MKAYLEEFLTEMYTYNRDLVTNQLKDDTVVFVTESRADRTLKDIFLDSIPYTDRHDEDVVKASEFIDKFGSLAYMHPTKGSLRSLLWSGAECNKALSSEIERFCSISRPLFMGSDIEPYEADIEDSMMSITYDGYKIYLPSHMKYLSYNIETLPLFASIVDKIYKLFTYTTDVTNMMEGAIVYCKALKRVKDPERELLLNQAKGVKTLIEKLTFPVSDSFRFHLELWTKMFELTQPLYQFLYAMQPMKTYVQLYNTFKEFDKTFENFNKRTFNISSYETEDNKTESEEDYYTKLFCRREASINDLPLDAFIYRTKLIYIVEPKYVLDTPISITLEGLLNLTKDEEFCYMTCKPTTVNMGTYTVSQFTDLPSVLSYSSKTKPNHFAVCRSDNDDPIEQWNLKLDKYVNVLAITKLPQSFYSEEPYTSVMFILERCYNKEYIKGSTLNKYTISNEYLMNDMAKSKLDSALDLERLSRADQSASGVILDRRKIPITIRMVYVDRVETFLITSIR